MLIFFLSIFERRIAAVEAIGGNRALSHRKGWRLIPEGIEDNPVAGGMMQSTMMRSAVHVAPLCVDKMQQQRIDHLGLETVECTFRRRSNMFWGVGVEDWSCKVAEEKRVQHLQVEDLQSSKVVVSVRAGSSDQIIPATQRMPPNHKIKAASLLVFQELRNATANRKLSFPVNSIVTLSCSQYEPPILLPSSSSLS